MRLLTWDCDRQGCYHENMCPKLGVFDECLPPKMGMSDVDGIVEINGRFLLGRMEVVPRRYTRWSAHNVPATD